MRTSSPIIATVALLTVACGTDHPVGVDSEVIAGSALETVAEVRASQGAAVARASGGADWVLEVFGFVIPQTLGFSARKYSDGTVLGHINYQQTFEGSTFHFNATVTCMSVYDGNRVKFGGEVQVSNDPTLPPGTFIWFQAIDNGEGANAPSDMSTGSGFGTNDENQAFCDASTPPNPLFLAPINGNIQVAE